MSNAHADTSADALTVGAALTAEVASVLEALKGEVVVAIGSDIVEIDRVREVIARRPRLVDRTYTETEAAYCLKRNDPAERFAVRFAAKEAVLKALGVGLGGAAFKDIEVVRLESGKPELKLRGSAAELAAEQGIRKWLITMSHSDVLAQVFVAGLGAATQLP